MSDISDPMPDRMVLTLSCPDKPGIVAAVANSLFDNGCNILDAQQFNALDTAKFFMRVVFDPSRLSVSASALRASIAAVAAKFSFEWSLRPQGRKQKVMLLVSKFDHCLADILYRWQIGELAIDPVGIIANYPRETYAHLDFGGVPFHYLPVSKDNRPSQEGEILRLIQETDTDVVVLARYMQVLSDQLAATLAGRCINIHHSFLPGFKGAKPYHQAFLRGVKLIGATAHYVTAALDEGPIIEQDVERISHRDTPDDLIRKGRDIERRVLARALRHHVENRVLINETRTIVFAD